MERGITLISEKSLCAAVGRSPPRMVTVRRAISPRRCNPASASAPDTWCDNQGVGGRRDLRTGNQLWEQQARQDEEERPYVVELHWLAR